MSENRSEQSRYLNADEQRQVNEYADQYRENPPDFADQITDDLDRLILQSEALPTLETVNSLAYTRRVEAERRVESRGIPENVREACAADDAMADLDDSLAAHVRGNAPLSEDGGESYRAARLEEVETGQAEVKRQRERAEKAAKQTAARFMGTSFGPEGKVTAEQFYRREGKR
jgi:hypothetical protein